MGTTSVPRKLMISWEDKDGDFSYGGAKSLAEARRRLWRLPNSLGHVAS